MRLIIKSRDILELKALTTCILRILTAISEMDICLSIFWRFSKNPLTLIISLPSIDVHSLYGV